MDVFSGMRCTGGFYFLKGEKVDFRTRTFEEWQSPSGRKVLDVCCVYVVVLPAIVVRSTHNTIYEQAKKGGKGQHI